MIERNLTIPHRFVLLTDRMKSRYDKLIEPVKLWDDWRTLRREEWREEFPQCLVRLKAFSPEMSSILGERFVSIDLDCVVTGNLDAILSRTESFLICRRAAIRPEDIDNPYQASMWMMDTGARAHVWTQFRGAKTLDALADKPLAKYYLATDQGWILYALGPDEAGWTGGDGVYGWPWLKANECADPLPDNARIVFFQGNRKPWNFEDNERPEWIARHYN